MDRDNTRMGVACGAMPPRRRWRSATRRAGRSKVAWIAVAFLGLSLALARPVVERSLAWATLSPTEELGGFFSIHCSFSHSSRDDPIVYPGQPTATHLHDFFGGSGTNFASTPVSLAGTSTSCANAGDTAGYWTPAPLMTGVVVQPSHQNEYWFDGGFKTMEMIPFGMEIVAGHSHALGEQPTSTVFFYCGQSPRETPKRAKPYSCKNLDEGRIIMVIVFPQCWDGTLPAGNDTSHLAYPTSPGTCPTGFPHVLPRLEEHVHTGIISPYDSAGNFVFSLSSGPYYTVHGDFMNAWSPSTLREFVDDCMNAHKTCASKTPS